MVDTTTTVLGLVKQTIGGNRNTWGAILNAAMDLIEGALYGMTTKVVTGGSVTLSDDERRKRVLNFTGTLGSNQIVVVPNLVGRWTVRNGTAGDFTLSFKTSSGSAIVIPQGGHCDVWCDGNDVVYAGLSSRLRDTQMVVPDGTLAAPGASFASEVGSGWRRVSAAVFAFVIGGVDRIRVDAALFKVTLGSAVNAIVCTDTGIDLGVPLTVRGETPYPIGGGTDYDGIYEPNGWKFRNGQELDRETYALLFAVLTATAGATRNGSTTLSSVDEDFTGLGLEGSPIEGTGIASGTTIASLTSNSITLSQAASGSGAITIRILPHGAGDGSETFNVPDDRGRNGVGRDNMGGTSANRLTGLTGGIDGDRLNATGGEESHQLGKAEMPVHSHGVTDPGHSHTYTKYNDLLGGGSGGSFWLGTNTTDTSTDTTGISIDDEGGDDAHNNVQPSRVTNKIIFTGVYD